MTAISGRWVVRGRRRGTEAWRWSVTADDGRRTGAVLAQSDQPLSFRSEAAAQATAERLNAANKDYEFAAQFEADGRAAEKGGRR